MIDNVSDEEKKERRDMVDQLQKSILAEKNKALNGEIVSVLVEDKKDGRWRGRTVNNRLVFFEDERDLLGASVPVEVKWTGPYSLIGNSVN